MQHTDASIERPQARRPTQLLRDILDISEEFEEHVGRTLSVNATDLEAMEHLIMSGPLTAAASWSFPTRDPSQRPWRPSCR